MDLVGRERLAYSLGQVADLVADHLAVHEAQPLQHDNRRPLGHPEILGDLSLCRFRPHIEQLDAGGRAPRPHLLLETQEGLAVLEPGLGHETAAAAMAKTQ